MAKHAIPSAAPSEQKRGSGAHPHSRLKRALHPLRHTPLHPQWLVYLGEHRVRRATGARVRSHTLDIGCGDGWLADEIGDGVDYVGLDYPVTVAKGYLGRAAVFGSADALPFPDNTFDTVLLLDVLEHLAHPAQAVCEASRVLRPNGCLIVQTPFLYPLHDVPHDFQRWTEAGLSELLQSHGLRIRECHPWGRPLHTAAALLSIALARGLLELTARKHWSILLAPLLAIGIPITNLSGWLLARLLPESDFMPLSYRIIAEKPL
ncbi:class I SAM-dependent methyltransferase [Thiorhodococcus minor]|uniref:Class I SAM-dependent methyltransferase n=1 Tax=Thiorhodococcus minor TaxID=57489 RepID=A0A6M0K501_9GAMM|nr:class I SAM-dependent methyltransferase [Thiorhodococcus minor]NEV64832.1 class I SAM-dependent methyltransferase [Thiorhodococcus minor]